jgi:hypothetical protein
VNFLLLDTKCPILCLVLDMAYTLLGIVVIESYRLVGLIGDVQSRLFPTYRDSKEVSAGRGSLVKGWRIYTKCEGYERCEGCERAKTSQKEDYK